MDTGSGAPRVLFVDDEPHILRMLKKAFSGEPWELAFAGTGIEALAKFDADGPYDVVVADQKMPGMTGVELLRVLRHQYPATARVILSGYAEVDSILDAVNEGFVYKFLIKTSKLPVIRDTIREVVEAAQLRRENRRLAAQLEAQQAEVAAVDWLAKELEASDFAWLGDDLARCALDAMPLAVLVLGSRGEVLLANPEASRLLAGPDGGALVGRPFEPDELEREGLAVRRAPIRGSSGWSGTVCVVWEP